ncbi:MAG: hypothetical protein LKE39_08235 [Sphaerochaeta sp.]|nr:hypothetical protein [Sphaerochaeta sp.]MCH3920434.1 hypothetical protein [Sphaerochaeta sp.]MCI2045929.1 hypothetical protein [Sphaerochaeta sp.]MCI2076623.1 hypothetical protein [Sphaerochaeta sp.]MCI2097386.1 hypothetical protein [Sphaerochaeta sp.]
MNPSVRDIMRGNFLIILCCCFYLAWWVVAFHPKHPIVGFASGWLLIPATLLGVIGVVWGIKGTGALPKRMDGRILVGLAVGIYLLLLLVSRWVARPVTTELFLIVGWGLLMAMECNGLFAANVLSLKRLVFVSLLIIGCFVLSLVCYVRYYHLAGTPRYVDGMVPLLLVIIVEGVVSLLVIR